MQFDEKDLDKNDDNFSLGDESNSISWEDLLNDDESVDLSRLIKQGDEQKTTEAKELQENNDFDLSGLVDNTATADTETLQPEVGAVAKNAEETKFDIENAASSYVNSLNAEESIVTINGNISKTSDDDLSNLGDNDSLEELVDTDSLSMLSEEPIQETHNTLLDEEFQDKDVSSDVDLTGVVDDELLNLLDEGDAKSSSDAAFDAAASAGAATAGAYSPPYEDEQNTEEEYPAATEKKKGSPVVLVVAFIALLGIFVAAFLGFSSFFGKTVGAEGDITSTPDTSYGIPDDNNGDVAITEEEANALLSKVENKKPEAKESKQEETKVVVSIPVGGRINPFVPSALFDENGFANFGADLSTPPEVDINSPDVSEARKLFSISVSGIMYDSSTAAAILKFDGKDYFVQKGDRIDTYTVKSITKEAVTIANGQNEYKAYVGETFQTKERDIPPSNQIKMENGNRQYISRNDIQISTK